MRRCDDAEFGLVVLPGSWSQGLNRRSASVGFVGEDLLRGGDESVGARLVGGNRADKIRRRRQARIVDEQLCQSLLPIFSGGEPETMRRDVGDEIFAVEDDLKRLLVGNQGEDRLVLFEAVEGGADL